MNTNDGYEMGLHLWRVWTRMWNGEPELAREIVADRFVLHLPTPSGIAEETVDDPAAVERWVRGHRARFDRMTFDYACGPFVDVVEGIVAGPWFADTSIGGAPRPVCGMDTIAFRDGKITEYWSLSKEVERIGRWGTREARR